MPERFKKKIKDRKDRTNVGDVSFWFVRHGQSEGNVLKDACPIMHNTPLTEKGEEESRQILDYLKKNEVHVTDVYSSPQIRSQRTAEIIANAFELPVKIKENLRERNWGDWKNLKWTEASEKLDVMSIEERYNFVPDGGESWKQMEERLFDTLEEIAEENTAGENVLIVMHKGGLRAILPKIARASIEKHEDFSVKTGALSKFSFDKDDFDFVGLIPNTPDA